MNDLNLTPEVKFWKDEIELYERTSDKWTKRGRKLYKRYKDVRSPREEAVTRFNVLWSNVQTRLAALYARDPKPEVERRFKDKDPVGRVVSEILERGLDYTITHCNPFGRIIRQALLDYELPGRGTVWVRYVPHFKGKEPELLTNQAEDETEEELQYEETILDYVYWEDFGHTWARTWDEVRAVWRRVYLTKEEGQERFGEKFDNVPMDWSPKNLNDAKITVDQKKAIVYEIWDKQEHKAIWVIKNHPEILDEKADPMKLKDFFPCPPPLFANLAADELFPVPNFTYYQDQANEIDELSTRIASIGKALKVAGIYDASAPGIDRLLSEGVENQLIPIDGWSALMQKGGLKGAMEFIPLDMIAEALGHLREQRQGMIDDIYEITGIADIIRGNTEPNETATAQQLKGQFAVLRIADAQLEVQRFCRDIMRIMAQLIASYSIDTLKVISGVKLLTNEEKVQLNAQLAALQSPMPQMQGGAANSGAGAAPAGAPMPMPGMQSMGGAPGPGSGMPMPAGQAQPVPAPDPTRVALLKEPSWEDVAALLSNPVLTEFRVDVETDSTIRIDEESDRKARMEFIQSVSNMIMEASNVPHALIPAAGELIMFGIRGFKVARGLEHAFEDAIEKLAEAPPPPDPEMQKMQMQLQAEQQKAQLKAQSDTQVAQAKVQADAQLEQSKQELQARGDQARNQMELERSAYETRITAERDQQIESLKAQHDLQIKLAEIDSKQRIAADKNATDLQIAQLKAAHEAEQKERDRAHEAAIAHLNNQHAETLAKQKPKEK